MQTRQHGRGNPIRNHDPSGHDPIDTGWRNEFHGEHGYWPDAADEAIRLFSLAYPSEWDASKFYSDGGTGARIEGAQKIVFQDIVPGGRNWDTLGTALTRLAGWYLAGEEAMFIQDVEFLFAGSPSRTQSQADGVIYWTTEPGYAGNLHVFIHAGTLDPKFYLNREGSPTDADMNVHHWAWGVAVGYNLGWVSGDALNTGRELAGVNFDVNRVNVSDIYMGRAGVYTGADLWWNPNDISSTTYKYLEMAP